MSLLAPTESPSIHLLPSIQRRVFERSLHEMGKNGRDLIIAKMFNPLLKTPKQHKGVFEARGCGRRAT
jgi:hypothetical protein